MTHDICISTYHASFAPLTPVVLVPQGHLMHDVCKFLSAYVHVRTDIPKSCSYKAKQEVLRIFKQYKNQGNASNTVQGGEDP